MLKNNQIMIFRSYTSFVALLCMALSSINCAGQQGVSKGLSESYPKIKQFYSALQFSWKKLHQHLSVYSNLPLQFLLLMPNLNATPALYILRVILLISSYDISQKIDKNQKAYSLFTILALLIWVSTLSKAASLNKLATLFSIAFNLSLLIGANLYNLKICPARLRNQGNIDSANKKSDVNNKCALTFLILMFSGFGQWVYGFLPPSFTSFGLAPYFCMLILQLVIEHFGSEDLVKMASEKIAFIGVPVCKLLTIVSS